MMEDTIKFLVRGEEYSISNSWEKLDPYLYASLIQDIQNMANGQLSIAMVRVRHICRTMGWDIKKIKTDEGYQNLAWLAEQITFPFLIEYPDNDSALRELDDETRKLCKRIPPHRLPGITISKYLKKLDYRYTVDSCFCKQLVPFIEIDDEFYSSYKIDTRYGYLTCSLTALQFIEAKALIGCTKDKLPLLAAVLYYPEKYSSEGAHELAERFAHVPDSTLVAIAFNFQAFVNYLFTKTQFRLLTEAKETRQSNIVTGALESLYNLSADGLGDIDKVEQMNVIQYLTILRKKLIDTVRSLHAAKMENVDIEKETGLPICIISQIL